MTSPLPAQIEGDELLCCATSQERGPRTTILRSLEGPKTIARKLRLWIGVSLDRGSRTTCLHHHSFIRVPLAWLVPEGVTFALHMGPLSNGMSPWGRSSRSISEDDKTKPLDRCAGWNRRIFVEKQFSHKTNHTTREAPSGQIQGMKLVLLSVVIEVLHLQAWGTNTEDVLSGLLIARHLSDIPFATIRYETLCASIIDGGTCPGRCFACTRRHPLF